MSWQGRYENTIGREISEFRRRVVTGGAFVLLGAGCSTDERGGVPEAVRPGFDSAALIVIETTRVEVGILYDPYQGIVSNNSYEIGHMWPAFFRATKSV